MDLILCVTVLFAVLFASVAPVLSRCRAGLYRAGHFLLNVGGPIAGAAGLASLFLATGDSNELGAALILGGAALLAGCVACALVDVVLSVCRLCGPTVLIGGPPVIEVVYRLPQWPPWRWAGTQGKNRFDAICIRDQLRGRGYEAEVI
jgi:hypothetical protein